VTTVRGLTPDEILDLPANVGEVRSTVRYTVLDAQLEELFRINPVASDVSIVVNTTSTVKRTMRGLHLDPVDNARIDVLNMRILPEWIVSTGTLEQAYPLGVFIFSDANRPRATYGLELKGTLYDQTVIVNQGRQKTFNVANNAVVTDVIAQVAGEVGLSGSLVDIDFSSVTVTTPIAWRAGTSRYTILEDLCALAGFYPPYFTNIGVLRCKSAPPSLAGLAPDHTYNAGPDSRIIDQTIVESDDLVNAPNRYLVVNNSGTGGDISGYYDLPDSAPQSYANRGYRVVKKIDDQGVENATQATARAQLAAITDFSTYNWAEFDATPDPRHDIFDIVEYLGENYREVGWDLKLKPGGPQSHKLRKIYA
jgi:hypothetical protein